MSAAACILDTETTGLDGEVIELAFMAPLNSILSDGIIGSMRFKPSVPITIGAMAAHHIIEEDLKDCPPWPGKWEPEDVDYLIGHNVDFDWKMIGSPPIKRICTLALSRWMFPKLDSHSLSAMIYHLYPLCMARDLVKNAHSAEKDVELCWRVLGSIVTGTGARDWDHLYQLSETARVPTHFTFGKYGPQDGKPGMPVAWVRQNDRGYVQWCLRSCDIVKDDPYWQKALTA